MDHSKIVVSVTALSLLLALVILGTESASARDYSLLRRGGSPVSTVDNGDGLGGRNRQTAKPPMQPSGSVSAKPNVTVTLGAWRNIRPTESYLNGVSLLPSSYSVDCRTSGQTSEGWSVGSGGAILSYCNGVWDHAIVVESIPTDLYTVQAISPTLAVAVGDQGAVLLYLYDNTALNYVWTKAPIAVSNRILYSVSMVPRPDGSYYGWAVGYSDPLVGNKGTLVQGTISAPSGYPPQHTYNWTNVSGNFSLPVVQSYYAVHTLSASDAWAVGGVGSDASGIIIHWNGSQWSVAQTVADPLYGIRMKTATEGWAVGKGGAIYHYNGSTWSKVSSPSTQVLTSIDYAPNGEMWIAGYQGALLKYASGSWQQVPEENQRTDAFDFRAIDFTSGHGWVVGANYSKSIGGQILEYDNGLWLPVTPPTDNRINAVDTVSDNDAWAVGAADGRGGTIIHWDGKHWQRWFQADLPIPSADLYAISMASATDGWAAGDPLVTDGPAVFLHWDGRRWAEPRYDAPANVRINDLQTYNTNDPLHPVFAWAVAENGNAFPKYQTSPDYWTALHSCGGAFYQLFGVSIISGTQSPGNWDAWAVGKRRSNVYPYTPLEGAMLRFTGNCGGSSAWDLDQIAPYPDRDATFTTLYGIKMMDGGPGGPWGYAVGNHDNRATIYTYYPITQTWGLSFIQPWGTPSPNPSNFYSVDIVKSSQIAWIGGFWSNNLMGNKKWEYLSYIDATGRHWVDDYHVFPVNGTNIYHRPIKNISMGSDTMGWAVGDPEDPGKRSVIYQYPYPNFTLNASPAARAVSPGGSTTFTVTVNSIGGFSTDVSLSLSGLPAGISAAPVPSTVDSHSVATVNVNTSISTATGSYCLPLAGSATFLSGDVMFPVSRETCLNLFVTNVPVYSVTPDHGAAGTTVTISGNNFGNAAAGNRSTAANHVSWGHSNVWIPESNILSWSNTQITFRPLDDPSPFVALNVDFPLAGSIKVTANGSASNDNLTFKIEPWITNLAKMAGPGGVTITLTGTSFGNDPGSLLRSTMFEHVALNGSFVANSSVVSWSNTSIVFTVPSSTPDGSVTVTSNGFESNAVFFTSTSNKMYLPYLRR